MLFNLKLPLNSTSFGNVSVCILRELYERNLQPNLFCIGNPDLSTQQISEDFGRWIQSCINKSLKYYRNNIPSFAMWHLNGSHEMLSNKQILLSYYELDSPTDVELNIIKNQQKVLFTSNYTVETFKDYGAENVDFLPLGFDKWSFHKKDKQYFNDTRIRINIVGKFEKRKCHDKLIQIIADKWGNDPNFIFQFAIYNFFIKPEDNQNIVNQLLQGRKFWNMQFLGFMPDNAAYNDYLNSADGVLAMSGGESWGLPEMHSVAMGKHALVHNVNGYKEWATAENSVLVNPSGKVPVYDGMFFHPGQPFNQGNLFSWSPEDFIEGFRKLAHKIQTNRLNEKGLELQSKFSYKNTVDKLLQYLND